MSKTFVVGDIHGARRALDQVLERSGFDKNTDTLIVLGDVCDGWPETKQVINELLTIPNLIHLIGNHDAWFRDWLDYDKNLYVPDWLTQGGRATLESYRTVWQDVYARLAVPDSHKEYLYSAKIWRQIDNKIFVHGGWYFQVADHPMNFSEDVVTWDRSLWGRAIQNNNIATKQGTKVKWVVPKYEIFLGHTTTTPYGILEPIRVAGVWNLDQGAGWEGKLSIMDINTKEYWQSDIVAELYPDHKGRR